MGGRGSSSGRGLNRRHIESANRGVPSTDGKMKTAIAYHASFADFDKFDKSKSTKNGSDLYGSGNYFADSVDQTYPFGERVYQVELKYSTDFRTAKKTGRKKDYQYNPKTGYWVIPQESQNNIKILKKGRWAYDSQGNRKIEWDK